MHIAKRVFSSLPRGAWHRTASTGRPRIGGRSGTLGRAGKGTKHVGNTGGPVARRDRVGCTRGRARRQGQCRSGVALEATGKLLEICLLQSGGPEAHLKQQTDMVRTVVLE